MIAQRNRVETRYPDGRIEIFDPLIRWHWGFIGAEIGLRGDYSIGWRWRYPVGNYTRYRKKWVEIGPLTLYVNFGMREPHDPRTGKSHA